MNELKNRGVQDILIAVVDGLKGISDAITAAFPDAMVQTCVVHLMRHSLNFCSWKDRKAMAAGFILVSFDLSPGQHLFRAAVGARHPKPSLVAFLECRLDPARTLIRRR